MPLFLPADLPAFSRLSAEGLPLQPAAELPSTAGRPPLRLALVNMMVDAALEATERQFLRLVAAGAPELTVTCRLLTLPELPRGERTAAHIARHYDCLADLRRDGLDALIISGVNVEGAELGGQVFWQPLVEVLDWSAARVPSTLCSCLATHAVLEQRYGRPRRRLPSKRWGVFTHQALAPEHPLLRGVPAQLPVPQSRYNEVPESDFLSAGLRVLVAEPRGGVHLAVSPGFPSLVCWQGHPEYDGVSLLKEYRRELEYHRDGRRPDEPPVPEGLLGPGGLEHLATYRLAAAEAAAAGTRLPAFPETELGQSIDPVWRPSAVAITGNWLRLVAETTGHG